MPLPLSVLISCYLVSLVMTVLHILVICPMVGICKSLSSRWSRNVLWSGSTCLMLLDHIGVGIAPGPVLGVVFLMPRACRRRAPPVAPGARARKGIISPPPYTALSGAQYPHPPRRPPPSTPPTTPIHPPPFS